MRALTLLLNTELFFIRKRPTIIGKRAGYLPNGRSIATAFARQRPINLSAMLKDYRNVTTSSYRLGIEISDIHLTNGVVILITFCPALDSLVSWWIDA